MFSQMLKVCQEVRSDSACAVLASTVLEIERNQDRILHAGKVGRGGPAKHWILQKITMPMIKQNITGISYEKICLNL